MLPTPVSLWSIFVCPDNGIAASVCCFAKENISLIFFFFLLLFFHQLRYSSLFSSVLLHFFIRRFSLCFGLSFISMVVVVCLFYAYISVSSDKTTSRFAALWASPATCPLRWNIKDGLCIQTNGSLPAGTGSERCSQNIAWGLSLAPLLYRSLSESRLLDWD